MPSTRTCAACGHSFDAGQQLCPHCARPALYPNVYAAEDEAERAALRRRYEAAKREAEARGAATLRALEEFEAAVAGSRAVIARPAGELQRLATSDNEIYATFYQLLGAEVRLPAGSKWDNLRRVADEVLFPGYRERIRFAALTLDGQGLPNYGECFLVLRTELIAHRASAFEENSVLFMEHHDVKVSGVNDLPRGYRATWGERARLCVAKLAGRIDGAARAGAYSGVLLRRGSSSADDDFVEVHVWGPMTIRTIERVQLDTRTRRRPRDIVNKALRQRLAEFDVELG